MELREYLRILRKRGWIILLVAVIAAVSAIGFSKIQTPVYRASIKLTVDPARLADYGQTLAVKNILRNYSEKLRTRKMAQRVVDRLQLDIPAPALLEKVSVDPDEANYTIQIDAKDYDPDVARQIVQTIAELFVQDRQAANLEVDQRDRIDVRILDSALAGELFSPKTRVNALAGGIFGVLLGGIILFTLEWLESDVIRSAEDVERYIGVVIVGSIPTITTRETTVPAMARPARRWFWRRA